MVAGDHFPTDVIAGAIIGSGIGLLVSVLHRRRGAAGSSADVSMRLVPGRLEGGGMVSLVGSF